MLLPVTVIGSKFDADAGSVELFLQDYPSVPQIDFKQFLCSEQAQDGHRRVARATLRYGVRLIGGGRSDADCRRHQAVPDLNPFGYQHAGMTELEMLPKVREMRPVPMSGRLSISERSEVKRLAW